MRDGLVLVVQSLRVARSRPVRILFDQANGRDRTVVPAFVYRIFATRRRRQIRERFKRGEFWPKSPRRRKRVSVPSVLCGFRREFPRPGKFAIAISAEWVDLTVLNRGRASFLTGKGSVMSDRSKAVRASSCYFNELLESRVLLSPILFVGSQFSAGIEPRSVAVADLNADGKPDLVTTNISSNNVSVLLGERQRDVSDPADLRRRQPAAFRRGVGCQRRRQAGPRDGELQFQQRERAAQYGRRHHAPGGARRELPLRGRASSPHSVPLLSGQNSNSFNWL